MFPNARTILGMAKEGRGDSKSVGEQMTAGRGGCWLHLTRDQYRDLYANNVQV